MKADIIFRKGSLWVGAHWSPKNRRWCVNLLPCVTIRIVLEGGTFEDRAVCSSIPQHDFEVLEETIQTMEYEPTLEGYWSKCKNCGRSQHSVRERKPETGIPNLEW
jgi:hypothetical protein